MLKTLDPLNEKIVNVYQKIEYELLIKIAERFKTYKEIGGTLEWHVKKLDELGGLNNDTANIISKYSGKTKAEVTAMFKAAGYANIDLALLKRAFSKGLIKVDPAKMLQSPRIKNIIDLSYKTMIDNTLSLINTKARESAKKAYMDVLNTAYIETASGIYDYNTSINKALQRMAANGITGATYSRNGTIVHYSLEGTVRRDTLTAVNQLANKVSFASVEELGAEYVEISSHLGARVSMTNPVANHAGWQGKVFKIHGFDEKYGNLKTNTGYPDDILGLGGVNCRHRMYPFFPDISEPNPQRFTEQENAVRYKLEQTQRAKERNIRKTLKQLGVAETVGDTENIGKLKKRLLEQRLDIKAFCENNGLTRDFEREKII